MSASVTSLFSLCSTLSLPLSLQNGVTGEIQHNEGKDERQKSGTNEITTIEFDHFKSSCIFVVVVVFVGFCKHAIEFKLVLPVKSNFDVHVQRRLR